MEKWGGVDLNKVMHLLVELDDKSAENIKANFLTFVEEVRDEEKAFKERIQAFKESDNMVQVETELKKRAELLEKRKKLVEEKKSTLFSERKEQINIV